MHGDPISGVDPTGESFALAIGIVAFVSVIAYNVGISFVEAVEDYSDRNSAVGFGGLNITIKMNTLASAIRNEWDGLSTDARRDIIGNISDVFDDHTVLNFDAAGAWDVAELAFGQQRLQSVNPLGTAFGHG